MKGLKRARRELEVDPFFKSMLDEMIAYQTTMKDMAINSKGQKRIDTTTADQIRNTILGSYQNRVPLEANKDLTTLIASSSIPNNQYQMIKVKA